MGIELNRIYTKSGDKGRTSLVGGERVLKSNLRLEAYGTVDELNSFTGLLRTLAQKAEDKDINENSKTWFSSIQNKLFDLGSNLATPAEDRNEHTIFVDDESVKKLEEYIDYMQQNLEPLKSFTLPGGGELNSYAHIARTVCRRAERVCWQLESEFKIDINNIKYLNRLSDFYFVYSRWVAKKLNEEEFLWQY